MWYEKYVGQEYSAENDCMALAVKVAEEFGYKVKIPHYKDNVYAQAAAMKRYKDDYGVRIAPDEAQDGIPVLFLCRKRFYHCGVYVWINGEAWILHADQTSGFVILTRLRDMANKGYELEGFYKWI